MDWLTFGLLVMLVVVSVTLIAAVCIAATMFSGAPWVPTPLPVSRAMCDLASVKPGDRVLDLGCGDASILLVAASQYGAVCMGVELNPLLVWIARWRAWRLGVSDRVTITRADMFTVSLPDVDVVMLYLLPSATHRIEERLVERYTHLTVVSHGFSLQMSEVDTQRSRRTTVRKYCW